MYLVGVLEGALGEIFGVPALEMGAEHARLLARSHSADKKKDSGKENVVLMTRQEERNSVSDTSALTEHYNQQENQQNIIPDYGNISISAIVSRSHILSGEGQTLFFLLLGALTAYPHKQLSVGVQQVHVLVVQVALVKVIHLPER